MASDECQHNRKSVKPAVKMIIGDEEVTMFPIYCDDKCKKLLENRVTMRRKLPRK